MACTRAGNAEHLTHEQHKQLLRDFEHIPDEKLEWSPMGEARTPMRIFVECAGAYAWLAAKLKGEADADAQWGAICEMKPPSREEAVALFEAQWETLTATFDGVEESQLGEKRQVFWGEASVGELLHFCEWHSTYHSGQLNYIQTMLGDKEMHMG